MYYICEQSNANSLLMAGALNRRISSKYWIFGLRIEGILQNVGSEVLKENILRFSSLKFSINCKWSLKGAYFKLSAKQAFPFC